MKKKIVPMMMLGLSMLSVGIASASGLDAAGQKACAENPAYRQFMEETAALRNALKAKDAELREQEGYAGIERGYEGMDLEKVGKLQTERKALEARINLAAQKHGIKPAGGKE
ncbi:hypothetical protein Geob_2571 [Geotalea daltonii FRC-32]|uniref:Uncharacterized protein n=1 Tax=Geotalea daltonii (strain DSM 22248 / JCM 15807 / FRC-32) TaxID=316067 RepID=B9M0R9_GEODF|nr:hypothetical protein [Geotalea daltonii]ACM20922.1 hypothetical protein Geob_2571 [Geotalea daltonii FRC-32]